MSFDAPAFSPTPETDTLAVPEGRAGAAAGAVLIVEEKPICRAALWQVLTAAGFQGPPRFAPSAQAVLAGDLAAVGMVVVDLFSINYDFGWLASLTAQARPRPVVVIDDRINPAFSDLARGAGAAAYGSKDQPVAAIEGMFADAAAGRFAFPELPVASAVASPRRLTRRQSEVLAQLGQGRTNREIADLLHITPGTVKLHIHQILRVTGARNRTEAALISSRFLAVPLSPSDV